MRKKVKKLVKKLVKKVSSKKKDKVVELLLKEVPGLFERAPRGALIRRKVEELVKKLK